MLKDLVSLGDSLILPGDGSSHTEVIFRYIVFRPQIGEVVTGKIRCCSRDGVHGELEQDTLYRITSNHLPLSVTLGFFDDILIPPEVLQHPSRFEEAEQAWVWEYPVEDGSKHDLYMDIGETIKFRVTNEIFEETSPVGGPNADQQSRTNAVVKTPYKILVSGCRSCVMNDELIYLVFQGAINESGLGVIRWWDQQTAEDDGDLDVDADVFEEDEDDVDEEAKEE